MKYLTLLWAGLLRKPRVTSLLFATMAIAFLLYACMAGVNAGFDRAIEQQNLDFLNTDRRFENGPPMPVAAADGIRRIPGVANVTHRSMFLGGYQDNVIAFAAVDIPAWFAMRPQFKSDDLSIRMMGERPTGFLATPGLINHYGWKVGEIVPFQSAAPKIDGSPTWELELMGSFDFPAAPGTVYLAAMNFDYFDSARVDNRGTTERFLVRIDDPGKSATISAAIDKLFENSAYPTRTMSEKAGAQARLAQMGEIRVVTSAVMFAVFFWLVFMSSNVYRQSTRARLKELAVMNALGFSRRRLVAVLLGEGLVLSIGSACVGVALARLIPPNVLGVIGSIYVSASVVRNGLVIAVVIAVLSWLQSALILLRARPAEILGRIG